MLMLVPSSREQHWFELLAALGELMMEYEIWDQNKHIGAFEMV